MTNRPKQHIFFVDDEPRVREAIGFTLEQAGFRVTCFATAADCLEQLRVQTFNLLITDVKMPGIDGIQLLREAKCLIPSLPVLILTGYADIPMAVEALKAGASDFIEKPVERKSLIQSVKSILRQRDSTDTYVGKPLTQTEERVLKLIINGKSNKAIADLLHSSTSKIRVHRRRIMRKAGMNIERLLESLASDRLVHTRKLDLSEFGKMIAGIRHDLVSALGVISTSTDLLRDDVHDPQCINDLRRISLATRYCGFVLGNLSDLVARTNPNKMSLDITKVIDEVIEIMANRIRPRIYLSKNYESGVPRIIADKGQIQRLFMNLIDNALQSIPDDGKISISVLEEHKTRSRQSKREIVVKVSDTGVGIPKKNIKKIFNLAFSTKRQGYGLGLYIVKQILDQHKGSIQVESQEQKGSTFILRLPVERNK